MLPHPEYTLNRRQWLGTSAAAIASSMLFPGTGQSSPGRTAIRSVISVWLSGGLSHLESWDPKPLAAQRSEFAAIETSVPGVRISEVFPELARQLHHGTVVRSLTSGESEHARATSLWTGAACGDLVRDVPAWAREFAAQRGQLSSASPVLIENQPFIELPTHAKQAWPAILTVPAEGPLAMQTQESVRHRLPSLPSDLALDPARERYGDSDFGRACHVASQLAARDVPLVQLVRRGFDTHTENFSTLRMQAQVIDVALATLISDLHESGLLGQTLVLVMTEFGRTPVINEDGGRGHWSEAFSGLIFGGAATGGRVIGATDRHGRSVVDSPITPADFHASLRASLGLQPQSRIDAL